jgi:predicted Zn-dependent protease
VRKNKEKFKEKHFNLYAYINLHCEKIEINNITDERHFGYIKLIYESGVEKYVDEIPLAAKKINTCIKESNGRNFEYISNVYDNIFERKKGRYPVVFSSRSSGYFCHEILGHLLEEDNFFYSRRFMNNGNIPKTFKVIDSIEGVENVIGLSKYDDEGTVIRPVEIISDGTIKNLISMNKNHECKSNGTARRENYMKDVMPRMRNTILIGKDDVTEVQMLRKETEIIYISDIYSGGVNIIDGSYFLYGRGWRTINGEKRNAISKLIIRGNTLEDLSNMVYIGKDYTMITGECSKFGNVVRVGMTGPSVFFSQLYIEGIIYGKI